MKIGQVARTFGGGVVVYVMVAACGASGGGVMASRDAGEPRDATDIVDAVVSPVQEAAAEAAAPVADVAVEKCDKVSGTLVYAEHAYAGRTVLDLSAVRVVYQVKGGPGAIAGYADGVTSAQLKDGAAAVICGTTTYVQFDSVTFILPP